jgi:hypothetical protein
MSKSLEICKGLKKAFFNLAFTFGSKPFGFLVQSLLAFLFGSLGMSKSLEICKGLKKPNYVNQSLAYFHYFTHTY